ncbi:EamA family transporter [Candidatus Woesearchaeota archaeon]|nr:EamA family transporter [Candidatus Woesearchaeota archaeon]
MATAPWAIGLVILASVVGALGPIYLKKGAKNFRLNFKALATNYALMLGVLFYGSSTIIFIPALRGGELSVLYPFVSLSYVWVSLLSTKMLKEKMNKFKWLGVLIIIIGVSLIGLGS